ncbi:S-adenosyl-L-methionine-dependent methyltransferase [Pterulicium gracile]|uniref:S-adenosyl-L-methionine-dependent methyltransferase n=1 Tax=Pterulicium gracile TaxID=1884261 RepID=A0A5C3QT46_9AGAR|nr:S-adenosyl-L-methionine-dependent methyltransferase [Pterula gracilis]
MLNNFRARLISQLGRAQANSEIKWMNQFIVDSTGPGAKATANTLRLEDLLRRRVGGEPLQYILGTQPFGQLDLLVRPPTLIPRHETEEWSLKLAKATTPCPSAPITILDLGTGTGCIPLLFATIWPQGSVHAHAVDISEHAVRLSTENALRAGVSTRNTDAKEARNTFTAFRADYTQDKFWEDPRLKPPYNLVTSNPPYIPLQEYEELPPSVRLYEDKQALYGGKDGLDFYRSIGRVLGFPGALASEATIALEVGHDQASQVAEIVERIPRIDIGSLEIWKDAWGKDRTVVARTHEP